MAKQLTLNQTINLIREIALSHDQINTVYFGDVWEFLAQSDNVYPAMFYSLTGSSISGKNLSMDFSLFFLDRQLVDETNETDVLSDQLLIAQDIFAMFNYPKFDWEIDQDVTIDFFTENEKDYLAGVKFDITLNYPMLNDRCQVPSAFSYPEYVASLSSNGGAVNYVKFLLDYPSFATLPANGDSSKIYVTNNNNKLYRWVDNAWVDIYSEAIALWGNINGTLSNQTDLQNALNLKAPLASPTFTGTVSGISKAMVGLGNVDNTTDLLKPISTATQTALNLKYDATNPAGYITGITSGNVTTALGFTPVTNARTITINGTALDLSANRSYSVGTVTSVGALTLGTSGTDVSSTVANSTTTPVITLNIPTASATNRGVLSSADWTTFNNKQSISSGTTNTVVKFTSSTVIGNSNITDSGTLITLGSNTYVNGNLRAGIATDAGFRLDIAGSTRFQGTTASDTAPLGAEIATTGTGTNWTGTSFATGYTHTVGSTASLTDSSVAVIGTTYRVGVTITGRTAGSITIVYGGETFISGRTTSIILARQAITTAGLVVTPTSDFDGTVVFNINSVGNSSASITFSNSSGSVVTEMRNSTFNNLFIGTNAGRKSTVLSNFNIQNTFIGNSCGQNNSNGRFNTFVGFECAFSNSAGDSLTAIGTGALYANTTGSFNIAMGQGALGSNTTGGLNTGLGQSALNANTTGGNNVGVGQASLSLNTTGSNNIAIGVNAGRNIASGSANTITNTSIYIGENTRASSDNQTNQIVIGHSSIGLGSNTTIIGNSSTVITAIYGDILLGGTTPITSALLAMTSTTEGFLPPRMTTTQKNAIATPATGLIVFDTTLGKLCVFSTTWQTITSV
jgi:hypothetical protein